MSRPVFKNIGDTSSRNARGVSFRWVAALLGGALSVSAADNLTLTSESRTLNVSNRDAEVTVSAAGIPDWQVRVPKGQVVTFRFDPVRVLIDIATPASNRSAILVRMPDGAMAEMGAASSARFDWFKDQTYYFSGAGKVSAKSPQGVASLLSSYFLPMTGGVREKDAPENNSKRRSPLVVVHVLSESGKELHVRIDKEEVKVKRGEVRRITHPNGSILELSHDEKLERLRWKVIKGYFEFNIPETECWRAYTVTDQEGGLRHEAGQKGADVVNLSPEGIAQPNENIFADLHHNVTAAVHRQADFRYRQREDCAHYDASSKGGPVDLSTAVQPGAGQAGPLSGGSAPVTGLTEPFGWTLRIPDGDAVLVGLSDAKQLFDFKTAAGNSLPLVLRLADGGRVDIGGNSSARLDLFKDQSYTLTGSGTVTGVNADGVKQTLTPQQLPMTGGPLVTVTDVNGQTRTVRLVPTLPVTINGELGGAITVQVGGQTIPIAAGDNRTVTLPNGAVLRLVEAADGKSFSWWSDKGDFRIAVNGVEGMKAVGLTEDAGRMVWDGHNHTAELSNIGSGGPLLVTLPGETLGSLNPNGGMRYGWVNETTFTTGAKGGPVEIYNVPLVVGATAGGNSSWTMTVPDGNGGTFNVNPLKALVDIQTPVGNTQPLVLRMADGGSAEIGGDSSARLDLFKDQTYYLTGSGQVTAVNADGQKFALSPLLPPMTGGPILVTTDENGVTRTTQLSPVTPVRITGKLGDDLIVQVGAQQVTVPADGSRTVTLPNGSVVKLTQSGDNQSLIWEADKGYFQFKVEGAGRWQADGLTDQSAAMQWSGAEKTGSPGTIDIKNLSSDGPLLVVLPGRNFAGVSPEGTLQFVQGDGPQFFVNASGGEVTIYNARTGTETTLRPSDLSLPTGGLDPAIRGLSRQPITVYGDEQTLIRVRGESATVSLLDNTERFLYGVNGSELSVESPARGTLVLESTTGGHFVELKALSGWSIDLPEGENLVWVMDVHRGIITATTSPENTTLVRIVTPDGFTPVLPPDTTITFILNRDGSLSSGDGFGKLPGVDLTRSIIQPPVSVIR